MDAFPAHVPDTSCARRYKPRLGDAVLFYDTHLNGDIDKHSLHGGCPVGKGEKWVRAGTHAFGAARRVPSRTALADAVARAVARCVGVAQVMTKWLRSKPSARDTAAEAEAFARKARGMQS